MSTYIIRKEWNRHESTFCFYAYDTSNGYDECIHIFNTAEEAETCIRLYHENRSKSEVVKVIEL